MCEKYLRLNFSSTKSSAICKYKYVLNEIDFHTAYAIPGTVSSVKPVFQTYGNRFSPLEVCRVARAISPRSALQERSQQREREIERAADEYEEVELEFTPASHAQHVYGVLSFLHFALPVVLQRCFHNFSSWIYFRILCTSI